MVLFFSYPRYSILTQFCFCFSLFLSLFPGSMPFPFRIQIPQTGSPRFDQSSPTPTPYGQLHIHGTIHFITSTVAAMCPSRLSIDFLSREPTSYLNNTMSHPCMTPYHFSQWLSWYVLISLFILPSATGHLARPLDTFTLGVLVGCAMLIRAVG